MASEKCGWCDKDAISSVTIRPARFKGVGVKRRVVAMAQVVPVCGEHKDIVRKQPIFYTCGCYYIADTPRCPWHDNKVRPGSWVE